MNQKDQISAALIEQGIKESLQVFESKNENEGSLSDLFLHFDKSSGILSVYDDLENLLKEVQLEERPDKFTELLRRLVSKLDKEQAFDKAYILKPFTVSLVDNNFLIQEELIFVDDNTLKLEGDIWLNFEKELDDFLKEIMN